MKKSDTSNKKIKINFSCHINCQLYYYVKLFLNLKIKKKKKKNQILCSDVSQITSL